VIIGRANVPKQHLGAEGLLGMRPPAAYNADEQQYSALLHSRLEELLRGKRNQLLLLRKYPGQPSRLGIMGTPDEIDRGALRLEVIEKMATDALVFLAERARGGPVSQRRNGDGELNEIRSYPTRYPHIVIERIDHFRAGASQPDSVQWSARRVQNQRTSTQINRMLDAANLGVDLVRFILH
jgi:hypothetical protein